MRLATLTSRIAMGALLTLLAVTIAGCKEEEPAAPGKEHPAKTAPKDHPAH